MRLRNLLYKKLSIKVKQLLETKNVKLLLAHERPKKVKQKLFNLKHSGKKTKLSLKPHSRSR
jgi:hypothetical protein